METKTISSLQLSSSAFKPNGMIPAKYTCDGKNINPPLTIDTIPQGTKSLAVIVDDPDAPGGNWDHWTVWNIPPGKDIKEDIDLGIVGLNDFGNHNFGGPCPPSGTHHYYFKVYALDTMLSIPRESNKAALVKAMVQHILAYGELIGLYKR